MWPWQQPEEGGFSSLQPSTTWRQPFRIQMKSLEYRWRNVLGILSFWLGSRHLWVLPLSRPAHLPCTSSHPLSPRRILHRCGSWSRWCARWWRFWCRTSPRPDGFPRVGLRRPPQPPSSTWCSPLSSTEQGLEPTVSSHRWRDVSLRSEHSKTQS